MSSKTKTIALGGMLAAVAVVIMCMGGLIPIATYICPMLCIMVQYIVFRLCGRKIAWVWYVVVALLSLLMGPDKEGAGVFLLLGYYPILKSIIERLHKHVIEWVLKLICFNIAAVAFYYVATSTVIGVSFDDFGEWGKYGAWAFLGLCNVVFVIYDVGISRMAGYYMMTLHNKVKKIIK